MSQCIIGTSGWFYPHWNEVFYPREVKSKDRLHFYSTHFNSVEINNTFYSLPSESTVKNWHLGTPSDFLFSIKASGYITHRKRLKDGQETTYNFFQRLKGLKEKLGPILFQLPPSFKQDLGRLEEFISFLPTDHRYTFEFRHESWFVPETYEILKKYHCALCITDLKGVLSPEIITGNFTYIRLHGPKSAYQGEYGTKRLSIWKKRINSWLANDIEVYCYFDNDEKSYAVKDALKLRALLEIDF